LKVLLNELNKLTGLKQVKAAVDRLVETAISNYSKERGGEEIELPVLSRLFLGNSGTGKTTVAKLYAKLLHALKLVSSREVVVRMASHFEGVSREDVEIKTRAVVDAAKGKVLLIDDAHNLADENPHCKIVIDAILEHDCVLIVGHERAILKEYCTFALLQFPDFTDCELLKILSDTVLELDMPMAVKIRAVKQLLSNQRADCCNARAVQRLVATAKTRFANRVKLNQGPHSAFVEADIEEMTESKHIVEK